MDVDSFWSIIERSSENGEVDEAQRAKLVELLSPLSTEELVSFTARYCESISLAYNADLADAITLINSGIGDDGFFDFRDYLVAKGRQHFERVLNDPETLLDDKLSDDKFQDWRYREMHFHLAAQEVFEIREGEYAELEFDFEWPKRMSGTGCNKLHDEECVKARYPRIWKHQLTEVTKDTSTEVLP